MHHSHGPESHCLLISLRHRALIGKEIKKSRTEGDDVKQDFCPCARRRADGSMRDFRVPGGADLLGRTEGFFRWQDIRRQNGLWPFSRATEDGPKTVCAAQDDSGNKMRGVNFASQDYLSLSSHPAIKATAIETIERCGVHSAGSPALVGNTSHSVALEREIAQFVEMDHVVLYPTGWAAGFGVVKGLGMNVKDLGKVLLSRGGPVPVEQP